MRSQSILFSPAALRLLSVAVACCVLINAFSARPDAGALAGRAVGQAFECQPLWQYYSAMAVIPVTLVSRLFNEPLPQARGSSRPAKKSERRTPVSGDSIMTARTGDDIVRSRFAAVPPGMTVVFPAAFGADRAFDGLVRSSARHRCAVPGFLLVFMIILRRRGLPSSVVAMIACINWIPRLSQEGRVYLCPEGRS